MQEQKNSPTDTCKEKFDHEIVCRNKKFEGHTAHKITSDIKWTILCWKYL